LPGLKRKSPENGSILGSADDFREFSPQTLDDRAGLCEFSKARGRRTFLSLDNKSSPNRGLAGAGGFEAPQSKSARILNNFNGFSDETADSTPRYINRLEAASE
jgi:hypothetical protein